MQIVLAGGSGFLGSALRRALVEHGDAVANLTRSPVPRAAGDVTWTPDGSAGAWARVLDDTDAVVNLAGEGIADRRWSAARKQVLRASRIAATRSLVAAILATARPPRVFVSASGVGYYGPRGDEIVTEATPAGNDFLARLCVEWEAHAARAAAATRVVLVRTGVVLDPSGGALAKMLLPAKLGVGGRLGSGAQYMPWIHRHDWIALVEWLIAGPSAEGAFNATAPEPVTNAEFARALGRAIRRPSLLPTPGIVLRLAVGEMAATLLTGQRAIPSRAIEMGFRFQYPRLDAALEEMLAGARIRAN